MRAFFTSKFLTRAFRYISTMKAFVYVAPENRVRSILNTIYAIFLGFLFISLFELRFDDSSNQLVLNLLITGKNRLPLCLLFSYFIFDWLTFNMTVKGGVNHLIVVPLIVLIVCLGALTILAFVPSRTLYLFFSMYLFIVSWWDLFRVQVLDIKATELAKYFLVYGIFLIRLSLGFYMLCFCAFGAWLKLPYEGTSLLIATSFAVLFKFIRYLTYVGLMKNNEREKCFT